MGLGSRSGSVEQCGPSTNVVPATAIIYGTSPFTPHWQLPSGYRLLLGPAERACTHRRRMGRTARRSRSQPAISTTCATRGGPPMAPPASNGRQLIDDSPEIAAARSVALLHTGTSPAPALLNSTALVVGHTLRKLSKYQHCNDPYGTKKQKIGKLPCTYAVSSPIKCAGNIACKANWVLNPFVTCYLSGSLKWVSDTV